MTAAELDARTRSADAELVHIHRYDHKDGLTGGPDSHYAGMRHAETLLRQGGAEGLSKLWDDRAALQRAMAEADERAAALVESMCDWTADFKGTRTVIEPDHDRWHLGYPCPYESMAAVLRGQPDPRRQETL